jgi:glycine/sarcosine N-methyltransferase
VQAISCFAVSAEDPRIVEPTGLNILPVEQFYAREAQLWPASEDKWHSDMQSEVVRLERALGRGEGKRALDCTCGGGPQALALTILGWNVTGTDATQASIAAASARASKLGLSAVFRRLDVMELAQLPTDFDLVISCMALDNLIGDGEMEMALGLMAARLRRGGRCHIRLRNFDHLMALRLRYEAKEVRRDGPRIRMRVEDWAYESDRHLVYIQAYLSEPGPPWDSAHIALRRRMCAKPTSNPRLQLRGLPISRSWNRPASGSRTSWWRPSNSSCQRHSLVVPAGENI